jgi:hypothetical protein
VHERVRVDTRSGLRAGPGCARAVTEERVFERWGAPYDAWAQRANRPNAPSDNSPNCPTEEPDVPADEATTSAAPRITYPFDGARFVIDPERPSALQLLEIRVEPDGRDVEVRVDGVAVSNKRAWPLAPGAHTITAHRGRSEAAPVRYIVR